MRISKKSSIAGGASHVAQFVLLIVSISCISNIASAAERWVGTWGSGQQLVNSGNYVASPYLANNTLRQIVRASLGGSKIRVQFSNKYTTSGGATTINSAHIALCNSYPITSSIDTATDTALTFNNGSASVTIPAGQEIYSDPIDFNVPPLSNLTVSIYFGTADPSHNNETGHPGSRTMYYLKTGNRVSDASMESDYKWWHWYILSRIDVLRDDSYGCVVALGDSITDGRGCDPNYDNRWPDKLADKLQADANTVKVGVINQGIGANAVLSDNPTGGKSALNRYDHDVIGQPGVRWVIVFEGTNDIGGASAAALESAYQTFINKAHANKILAYGATITPNGTNNSTRNAVNTWIMTPGNFDASLDFAAAVWDPADHNKLNPAYRVYRNPPGADVNDGLHFNAAGYQAIVNSIDANLFTLTADLDKDGIVNLVDFAILAGQWKKTPGSPSADIAPMLAGDGTINYKDLFLMNMEWLREE